MKPKKEKQVVKAKKRRQTKPTMKYVVRKNVQFVGLDILDKADQKRVKDILYKDYITLERELKKINGLRVHFKTYEKGGRKKYSVQLFIDAQTKPIAVNKIYSPAQWDPVAIVHKLLDKARSQITKKYRTDESYPKRFYRINFLKKVRDAFFK